MSSSDPTPPGPAASPWPAPPADLFRLLVESATDYAIFTADLDRRVTMWSSGAERLFLYSESEMLGQPADVIFVPEDRADGAPAREAARAVSEGRSANERWHMRKDRTRFYASGMMMPLRDAAGAVIGLVKINRDLTERQLTEDSLRASRDELERRVADRTRQLEASNAALESEIARRAGAEAVREQLLRRLASAEEKERLRLARELHDQIGQHLAALMLRLDALQPAAAGAGAEPPLAEAQRLVETIARDIHAIAVQLRPTALDDLGLAGAVSAYVALWSTRSGIPVHSHVANVESPRVPADVELALYRVLQEALTNVLKHAAASRVSLVINRTAADVSMVIEDNGRGFDADATAPREGLGLLGMRERVAAFNGRLTVESQPGGGTTVLVRVPLPPP